MINIFVGNLDITVTVPVLRAKFAAYGTVDTVTIVENRDTGEPRGIAFIEMMHATEARAAIAALDGTMLNGRPLRVNEARAKLALDLSADSVTRDHRRHRT